MPRCSPGSRPPGGEGLAEISLSGRDEQAFRARVGPAAGLLVTEYHGSTGSAALSGRHYMRFKLADVPALQRALRTTPSTLMVAEGVASSFY